MSTFMWYYNTSSFFCLVMYLFFMLVLQFLGSNSFKNIQKFVHAKPKEKIHVDLKCCEPNDVKADFLSFFFQRWTFGKKCGQRCECDPEHSYACGGENGECFCDPTWFGE